MWYKIKLIDGPLDGEIINIKEENFTKPLELLYNGGIDEHGRHKNNIYRKEFDDLKNKIISYMYDGDVIETGIEFDTEEYNI